MKAACFGDISVSPIEILFIIARFYPLEALSPVSVFWTIFCAVAHLPVAIKRATVRVLQVDLGLGLLGANARYMETRRCAMKTEAELYN